MEQADHTSKG